MEIDVLEPIVRGFARRIEELERELPTATPERRDAIVRMVAGLRAAIAELDTCKSR